MCTGTFTQVWELPCCHVLDNMGGEPLLLNQFHLHWYLIRVGQPQLLLEPRQAIETIRRTTPASSTKREPSLFELVEAQEGQEGQGSKVRKAPPTCSNCHAIGHTMTSKACPQRYAHILYLAGGRCRALKVGVVRSVGCLISRVSSQGKRHR